MRHPYGGGYGAQRFSIKAQGSGAFNLRNQAGGKCVDSAEWSTADGGNIPRRFASLNNNVTRIG